MELIKQTIRNMISADDDEVDSFLAQATVRTIKKKTILNNIGKVPQEVYFVNKGLLRVVVTDQTGIEHTIHFAMEGQFIADYSGFILKIPSTYALQAVEDMEVVVMPRASVEWGYANMQQGEKLGRLIAEYYFIYQDSRIRNLYERTPKERYEMISHIFPDIHNRAPQHMIASYLGVTPVHLSRLKKGR